MSSNTDIARIGAGMIMTENTLVVYGHMHTPT